MQYNTTNELFIHVYVYAKEIDIIDKSIELVLCNTIAN